MDPSITMTKFQEKPQVQSSEKIRAGVDEGLMIPGSSLDGDLSFDNPDVERLQ